MNFIRKIINDAAVAAWKSHHDGLKKKHADILGRASKILSGAEDAKEARERYFSTYSDEDLEAWVQAKMRTAVEFEINQSISLTLGGWVKDRADGLLFKAAVSSAIFILNSKRNEIAADDAARSEDTGVEIHSNSVLEAINRRIERLKSDSVHFDNYLLKQNAINSLSTAISSPL